MKITLLTLLILILAATGVIAQTIKVSPTGVNVDASNSTSVFLTYGPVVNRRPAEAYWCGELVPASPGIGLKCDPGTVFGALPARYNLSTASGNLGFTDIMSIPPSVARRAYQAAQVGANAAFFYVRRFVSDSGGPDEFVAVTCRLTGGGASVPFALTDVRVTFAGDTPVRLIRPGEKAPLIRAAIIYTGTGRLKGRWEVVLPGEQPPEPEDLLPEAALPLERRGGQRRYTQLSRFNVFLPPTGQYVLAGPEVRRVPTMLEGPYLVLLRIEATDDKEGDSDLTATGSGPDVVHSGAVAGFPMPVLRYFVGAGEPVGTPAFILLAPAEGALIPPGQKIDFAWAESENAALYRIEIEDEAGNPVLSALLLPGVRSYRAPSWLKDKVSVAPLRWRVTALNQAGVKIGETAWRRVRLAG